MDPYGLPYGYNHPSLAAASLWSGALLQYPFLRPRGLPQGYQPRFPGNLMQYNLPAGTATQPRPPPPPYSLPQVPKPPQDPKQTPRNPQFDSTILNKRDYPLPSMSQSFPNQRVHPQTPQTLQSPQILQNQYPSVSNVSNTPNPRVSAPDNPHDRINYQRDQINYRQPWRGPILPPAALGMRNYPINSNWASDPCSLLAALSPATLQNFTAPAMVQRVRKEPGEPRNCETPHLGKVNYSPNTARTLQCSNCALPGPLFKCLGCEVAFYCDETCQTRHWSRHVVSCPKKMPKLKKVLP